MNLLDTLRSDYQYLNDYLLQINDVIDNAELNEAVIYELPDIQKNQLGKIVESIPVNKITGQHALSVAKNHLINHKLKQGDIGPFVRRLPGVINITTNEPDDLIARIKHANVLKENFLKTILSISQNNDKRFELVAQAIPNLVKKALTRQIILPPQNTIKIGFTWVNKESSVKKTKEQWDLYLDESRRNGSPRHADIHEWFKLIDIEKAKLQAVPNGSILKTRRKLRTSPSINFRIQHTKYKTTSCVAHSPVWLINQSCDHRALKPYHAKQRKSTVRQNEELIIERLHLYLMK